ncbi:class I SAM-dependent methyltransferase [Desulfosarcina sp. OttesenSCG-928-A07]|nr:class I SAM-dependent methyltransferase [Desulfosarcina sp. OttesenSCG-928-A07]
MSVDTTLMDRIRGFLDPEEGMALYTFACDAAPWGPCLEIGSYCGKSAVYIGTACREHQTVLFSIDHHRGSEEQQPGELYFDPALFDFAAFSNNTLPFFRQTLALSGLEDTVIPVVSRSETVAKKWNIPLSLVFIDGGHAFETVRTDYQVWAKHLIPGGYLLIHDIFENPEEGGQAPFEVYQRAVASGDFEVLPRIRTLGVLRRKQPQQSGRA